MNTEMANGTQMTLEMSMPEIFQRGECWTFGAPCQDFSVAGKRAGLEGDRSSLIREVYRILEELQEEDRPEWLIYENVKGMLSSALPCFACFENGEIYDTYGRYCHFMEYDLCPDCERRYAQVVMEQFVQIAYVPGGKTRIEKRYVE